MLDNVTPGEHAYTAVARDSGRRGSSASAPRSVTSPGRRSRPRRPPPTPDAHADADADRHAGGAAAAAGHGPEVNVEIKSGKVLIKLRGTNRFVELDRGRADPGRHDRRHDQGPRDAELGGAGGKVETADFYDGIFKVTQTTGAKPVTVLTLVETLAARRRAARARGGQEEDAQALGQRQGLFRTGASTARRPSAAPPG